MERKEVFEILNEIFSDVFDEEITLNEKTCADDIEEWDSLEHINLMAAIESEFRIKFSMKEVNSFKNVGDMVGAIMKRSKS